MNKGAGNITKKGKTMKTKKLVFSALFGAIICVLAPMSIYIGSIPYTLATFAVYLAASVIDWKHGTLAVVLYILLGAVGLPVFSGFEGGFQKIAGTTGGYLIGYIPCTVIAGILIDKWEHSKFIYPVAMAMGTLALYIFGTAWFVIQTGSTLAAALAACVFPFLIVDAVKIVLASYIAYTLRFKLKEHNVT